MQTLPKHVLTGALMLSLVYGCSEDADPALDGSVDNAAAACELDWVVDSVVPCIAAPTLTSPPLIYSSHLNANGEPVCDPYVGFPQPTPEASFSKQSLISVSAGKAELCIAIKHGKADAATAADCEIYAHCETVDYDSPGKVLTLADLPGWSAQDEACARSYYDEGGYVEMRVTSDSLGCGEDGEQLYRLQMCPNDCAKGDTREKCDPCKFRVTKVSGSF